MAGRSARSRAGLVSPAPVLLLLALLATACVSPHAPAPAPRPDPFVPIDRLLADAARCQETGDIEAARRDFSEALRQCRDLDDPHLRRQILSRCYLARGDWYTAQSLLQASRLDYERAMPGASDTTRRDALARLVLVAELTGDAGAASRLRALLGDDAEASLERLRTTLFATEVAAAEPAAGPAADQTALHRRAEWHAAPLRPREADAMAPIFRLTIHHTASPVEGPLTESRAAAILRSIQSAHFQRGWADIGYHFLIDSSGRVWEGRPIEWQGAHAGNPELNRGNVGISLMGNFQDQAVPEPQKSSLARLVRQLCREYGIDVAHIYTHRELRSTLCPGAHLQAYVDQLRREMTRVARNDAPPRSAAGSASR